MRYFLAFDLISSEKEFTLRGEECRHMVSVNRMKPGDECFLLNGKGLTAKARITECGKKEIRCDILEIKEAPKPAGRRVVLAQALSRKGVFGGIVEKAVELNAEEIIPLLAERNVVKVDQAAAFHEKYQTAADQALKQCRRPFRMKVREPMGIETLCKQSFASRFLLDPDEGEKPAAIISKGIAAGQTLLVVGPEGGFTSEEITLFENHGFQKILLPGNILRSETAATAAMSLFQFGY